MAASKQLIDSLVDNLGVERAAVQISQDAVDVVVQKYIKKWQENLVKNNHMASDNLWQSLADKDGQYGFRVETKEGVTRLYLSLPDYYEYTDVGRKPTKGSGNGALRKALSFQSSSLPGWIAQKGLKLNTLVKQKRKLKDGTIKEYTYKISKAQANKNAAFAIARKIHTKGFKGTKWFSSEIDNFKSEISKAIFDTTGQIVYLTIEKIKQDTTQK